MGALDDVVRAGKVRFVGALELHPRRRRGVRRRSGASTSCSTCTSLFDRRMEHDLLPVLRGATTSASSATASLAYGLLSGTLPADHRFPADDWRSKTDKWGVMSPLFEHLFGPGRLSENVAVVEDLRGVAARYRPTRCRSSRSAGRPSTPGVERVARRVPHRSPRSTTTPARSTGRSTRRSATHRADLRPARSEPVPRPVDRERRVTMGDELGGQGRDRHRRRQRHRPRHRRAVRRRRRAASSSPTSTPSAARSSPPTLGDAAAFQRDRRRRRRRRAGRWSTSPSSSSAGSHVMFNNAGVGSSFDRLLDNDLADFDRVIGVEPLRRDARHAARGAPHGRARRRLHHQHRVDRRDHRRRRTDRLPRCEGGGRPVQPVGRDRPRRRTASG